MTTPADTARLREMLANATQGPWAYRPDEYDDWGFIRGPLQEFSFGPGSPIVAVSHGGALNIDHIEHRRNKTDPYEPNGRLIVAAVNSLPALLDEVDRLRAVAKFADHETVCRLNRRMGSADCTCGLDTARLALEPKP